ncbi:hypothetical protein WA588_000288 [Blastocystis sp. NMH]
MALNEFVRDNLDAFSFNMIIICILNIVVFLILFIMTMPLPDVMKRGYANFIFTYALPFMFFMMFCMYTMFYTIYKLVRNIHNFHMSTSNPSSESPRAFYKRVAKNQRDILLCICGCALSYFTLILSTQFKQMTTDKKVEEEIPEKPADEKKNDFRVC